MIAIGFAPGIRNVACAVLRVVPGEPVAHCLEVGLVRGWRLGEDADAATIFRKMRAMRLELTVHIDRALDFRDPVTIVGIGPGAKGSAAEPPSHIVAASEAVESMCLLFGLRVVVVNTHQQIDQLLGSGWRNRRLDRRFPPKATKLVTAAGTALAASELFHVDGTRKIGKSWR